MKEYFKLAWRNIWRNKRRTLITVASIFFAILIAIVMRSFQLGSYSHMINNFVETYSGYLQLQQEDYWENKSINNTFVLNDSIRTKILDHENIKDFYPRLESFALASSGNTTKGAFVMGVIPAKENEMTNIKDKIVRYKLTEKIVSVLLQEKNTDEKTADLLQESIGDTYTSEKEIRQHFEKSDNIIDDLVSKMKESGTVEGAYIKDGEKSVLVAEKLAHYLKIIPGDTLILISQGFHGIGASGLYPVKGIISLPNPELNKSFIYMPLKTAQEFYSANGRITSLSINVNNNDFDKILSTKATLSEKFDKEKFALLDWKEMNPELVQQIQSDNVSGKIMLAVLYIIIAFGIFSTVLMMTTERQREFGVMISIGMQKLKLAGVVVVELIFIGILGILSGIIASIPIILVGHNNPIKLSGDIAESMESFGMEPVMPFAMIDTYFLWQALVVIVIIFVAILYPVYSITRIKEIEALRA